MEGSKSKQKEKITNEGGPQGEHEQIKYSNPLSQGKHKIKIREKHLKKTFSLEEPSPIVKTHIKVEATFIRCNAIDTCYL
jgi:hypothetical protein